MRISRERPQLRGVVLRPMMGKEGGMSTMASLGQFTTGDIMREVVASGEGVGGGATW